MDTVAIGIKLTDLVGEHRVLLLHSAAVPILLLQFLDLSCLDLIEIQDWSYILHRLLDLVSVAFLPPVAEVLSDLAPPELLLSFGSRFDRIKLRCARSIGGACFSVRLHRLNVTITFAFLFDGCKTFLRCFIDPHGAL